MVEAIVKVASANTKGILETAEYREALAEAQRRATAKPPGEAFARWPITKDDKTAESLASQAALVDVYHKKCEAAHLTAVEYAVAAGKVLIETRAKKRLDGHWLEWLEHNVIPAPRTCQLYMKLARDLAKLPRDDAQRVARLPLREVVKQVARGRVEKRDAEVAQLKEEGIGPRLVYETPMSDRLRELFLRDCDRAREAAAPFEGLIQEVGQVVKRTADNLHDAKDRRIQAGVAARTLDGLLCEAIECYPKPLDDEANWRESLTLHLKDARPREASEVEQ